MRPHLEDHATGTLEGEVPQAYRARHHLDLCSVCGGLVASRFNGAHPRCRPAARRAVVPVPAAGLALPGPSIEAVFSEPAPVLRHVPKAARAAWAQCLSRALGQVAGNNTLQAWRDFFMLPKAVLHPAPRGGRRHRLQAAQFTQRRCARWLAGERDFGETCPVLAVAGLGTMMKRQRRLPGRPVAVPWPLKGSSHVPVLPWCLRHSWTTRLMLFPSCKPNTPAPPLPARLSSL